MVSSSLPPPPEEYDVDDDYDEDYANLTDEAKMEFHFMVSMNETEVYGFDIFREFWARHPSKHPNYFLQVESGTDDAWFREKLTAAQLSQTIQHAYPDRAKLKLIPTAVVSLLREHTSSIPSSWLQLHKSYLAAPDDGPTVYANTIKAASALLHLMYTEDFLYMIARQPKWDEQTKKLWQQIQVLQGKGIPVLEFCDKVFQITSDKDTYSFVTEGDITQILSHHSSSCCPFLYKSEPNWPSDFKVKKDEEEVRILDDITRDIAEVVTKMDSTSSISQPDVYTRRLMKLIRGPPYVELENLVNDVIEIVDANALVKMRDQQETIVHSAVYLLLCLLSHERKKVKEQVLNVVRSLYLLDFPGSPYISLEIFEIVEVAELRRMALGSRFIGRSHLMWAFFECGYGLPKIRKTIDLNSPDKDHPPYHIYVTAMKLAVFNGLKKMRLEHFIFAVLFAQGKVSEEPSTEVCQDFKDFMEDLALERTKVESESSKNLSSDFSDTNENIELQSLQNAYSESHDTNEYFISEHESWGIFDSVSCATWTVFEGF